MPWSDWVTDIDSRLYVERPIFSDTDRSYAAISQQYSFFSSITFPRYIDENEGVFWPTYVEANQDVPYDDTNWDAALSFGKSNFPLQSSTQNSIFYHRRYLEEGGEYRVQRLYRFPSQEIRYELYWDIPSTWAEQLSTGYYAGPDNLPVFFDDLERYVDYGTNPDTQRPVEYQTDDFDTYKFVSAHHRYVFYSSNPNTVTANVWLVKKSLGVASDGLQDTSGFFIDYTLPMPSSDLIFILQGTTEDVGFGDNYLDHDPELAKFTFTKGTELWDDVVHEVVEPRFSSSFTHRGFVAHLLITFTYCETGEAPEHLKIVDDSPDSTSTAFSSSKNLGRVTWSGQDPSVAEGNDIRPEITYLLPPFRYWIPEEPADLPVDPPPGSGGGGGSDTPLRINQRSSKQMHEAPRIYGPGTYY